MQKAEEKRVQSLDLEDPLEEEMATHSSILAWRIPPGQRSLVGYSLQGRKELDAEATEYMCKVSQPFFHSLNQY